MKDQRRDLRSMKRNTHQGQNAQTQNATTVSDTQRAQMEQIKQMAKPYENRSRDQLMQDAMRMVQQGKQQGTMDGTKLDGYMRMVSPMLNATQRSEMAKLIEQLKRA